MSSTRAELVKIQAKSPDYENKNKHMLAVVCSDPECCRNARLGEAYRIINI